MYAAAGGMRSSGVVSVLVVALGFLVAAAPTPAPPTRNIEDHAGLLAPEVREHLDAQLRQYQQATGHRVIVWIDTSLAGVPVNDWTATTFEAWQASGLDNGIVMFVFADDRMVDIKVGHQLASRVTSATTAVIASQIQSNFQAGRPDAAIIAGVDALLTAIEGRPWGPHVAAQPAP